MEVYILFKYCQIFDSELEFIIGIFSTKEKVEKTKKFLENKHLNNVVRYHYKNIKLIHLNIKNKYEYYNYW